MIHLPNTDIAFWIGIALCIVQAGIFSGLNLAVFSVSRLRLEVEAASGNKDATKLLALRSDSNFTLATIIWGSVATNVLLTLLSNSILAGLGAFLFSTIVITLLGEIIPQAYFSRNALRVAARFVVFLKFYQVNTLRGRKANGAVSQLVAWTGSYRPVSRARLPRPYVEARGGCRHHRRRATGSNGRTELSRP
jgi:metal transporter CNNM